MSGRRCTDSRARTLVTGVLLVAGGAALWAGARGWYSLEEASSWWPLIALWPAVDAFTAPPPARRIFAGLVWVTAAASLVALNLGFIHLRLADTIAVVFVVAGARLTYVAWMRRRVS